MQIDLASQTQHKVVVDREVGQYLGHVSTVMLEDGQTILAVYPKGHGKGQIIYQRSTDGGKTWSGRLPTPANWSTSKETPTIHRVIDPETGKKRVILWSGLYPARLASSADDGETWTELKDAGDWGGIVVMGGVERLKNGEYFALFHDDGRFFGPNGEGTGVFTLYQTNSKDGGLTWSHPRPLLARRDVCLCEPGIIRSPNGRTLAVALRENLRVKSAHIMFSTDEAKTWSEPVELPQAFNGDRHIFRYGPDGRLVCVFRNMEDGPWKGDFVAWVGTFDDLVKGRPGQYKVRLADNQDGTDCGYPGLELTSDGTLVATTYGHWEAGKEPYIMAFRFALAELDRLAKSGKQSE